MIGASTDLIDAYNKPYSDVTLGWRKLGAMQKSKRIINLCAKNGIRPKRVLEYGAGTGGILKALSEQDFAQEYYAAEISHESCKQIAKSNIKGFKEARPFDGYNTGFDDGFFDLIVLSHVLEHVEFERLVLREMRRLSQCHIIEVPLDYYFGADQRVDYFVNYGHINLYTPTMLRFLIMTEGFRIEDDFCARTDPDIVAYQTFLLNKTMEDTAENRRYIYAKAAKETSDFLALDKEDREARANSYTVLCATGDSKLGVMG